MNMQKLCNELGFDAGFASKLEPFRDLLQANSSGDFPAFMEAGFYTQYYPLCGGPAPEMIYPAMAEVARIVRANPAAARYASMLHYAFFQAPSFIQALPWPSPEAVFGRNTGIFQLMVALSCLPLVRRKHAGLNLPDKYMAGTARWIGGTIGIYAAAHDGYPGHSMKQTRWLRLSVDGKLFRIGRLEFLPRLWSPGFPAVYRRKGDRTLAVLCLDGWAFDAQGFRVDPEKTSPAFTAKLIFRNGKVTGTPVTPYGMPAAGRELTLDLREWEPLLAPWEEAYSIHIPAGGGMTLDAVRDSLTEAVNFFHDRLGREVKVFTCSSWILNPAWERELPDSNMAALERNVYMTPCPPPGGNPGLFFVYGEDGCDPRQRPCTTSLHQAFRRILDRGEELRFGSMFIPASEVQFLGQEYYRKKYTDFQSKEQP